MINKKQKVKIKWNDAAIFSPKRKKIDLSLLETIGFIEEYQKNYLIVKNQTTINFLTKQKYPANSTKNPTFYFIPKGMIKNITKI